MHQALNQMPSNSISAPQNNLQGMVFHPHSSDKQTEAQGGQETPQAAHLKLVEHI